MKDSFDRQIGHLKFSLFKKNATVKISLINTIHVKRQHEVGYFIFKFTLKFMLGNVYINKIYARECLYIISLYCRQSSFHLFTFFVESFTSNFKTA